MRTLIVLCLAPLLCSLAPAQASDQVPARSSAQSLPPEQTATSGREGDSALREAAKKTAPAGNEPNPAAALSPAGLSRRTELNLLGQTDTAGGESRRNENVQFNLVDNNALKELSVRLGTTATIVDDFEPSRDYFGAEYGNAPGSPLHVTGAAGSGIHGSVYEAHQNSVFRARSFFQAGDVKPARENDYGVTFGSPVWDGAYFFVDASQQRLRGSVNGNILVPRPDERTALGLENDPATRAIVEKFLAAYPAELPNRTDINPRALNTNAPQSIDNNNVAARWDQRLGGRDQLFLDYSLTTQNVEAFQLVLGQNPNADIKSHRARLTWHREWSPATLTDFSAGFERLRTLLVSNEDAVGPFVSVGSTLQSLGPPSDIPIDRALNLFRYAGQIRQVRGEHDWTAGFEVLRRHLNGIESDVHRGFFSFGNNFGRDAITNLRMGTPTQHIVSIGEIHRGFRNWDLQFFAGDRWRVKPNLTLNFSLRYEPITTPTEVNGLNVIPYSCDCNNFAPRFGFAYQLPQDWGVLRGAYGVQYGEIYPATYQQIRLAPPGNSKIVVPSANLADPLRDYDGSDPNILPTTYRLDENLVAPYAHQYNFSWEREVFSNWNLQLGYVGSRSHKLLLMWYLNRAHPVEGIAQTTATVNLRRENPNFAEIRKVINGSIGYFDAGRVSLVMRQWRGLSLDASYWFSKAIDLGSNYTNTGHGADSRLARSQSEFDQFGDMKALSDFDQPHAFLWTAAYQTPARTGGARWARRIFGEWNFAAVVLLKQGTPFNVITGSDAPGFGNVDANGGDRPNLLDASILGRTIGHPGTSQERLPRDAFAFIQPTDIGGNLGRNTFRKSGIRNINASISRSWKIQGDNRLTFRAESVNLFNTPQFAEPGRAVSNPNFGQITNTLNDGRTFRFLLKLAF